MASGGDAPDTPVVVATLVHDTEHGTGSLPLEHAHMPFGALGLPPSETGGTPPGPSLIATQSTLGGTAGEDDVRIAVGAGDLQNEGTARQMVPGQGTVSKPTTIPHAHFDAFVSAAPGGADGDSIRRYCPTG